MDLAQIMISFDLLVEVDILYHFQQHTDQCWIDLVYLQAVHYQESGCHSPG